MAIDKITTPAIADDAVTNAKVSYNNNPFRNIIINGDMSLAQRGTSFTALGNGDSAYTVDRFKWSEEGSMTNEWTVSQSTTVPSGQGFAKSLKVDCTTADTSIDSGNIQYVEQRVEGQNLQYLKYGTSSAESTTLSFWVRSNKTGTYTIALINNDGSERLSSQAYTISSADTWEKKTLTFTGDTSQAFDNDNASSLSIQFNLVAGTTKTSGSLQSWGSNTQANRAVGQVNLADSTSNEWYVTGVQLEAGTSASDFEFLPVDINLARCQRYFHKWVSEHVYANITIGKVQNVKNARGVYQNKVQFRSSPSLSADGNFRMVAGGVGTGTGSDIAVIRNNTYVQFLDFVFSGGSDSTVNQACEMGANNDADAEISFSAEL